MNIKNPIFSAFFQADKGYIRFLADLIVEDQEVLLGYLQLLKYNTKMYFGKGFKKIGHMIDIIKKKEPTKEKIHFIVRMFAKKMRGKTSCINIKNEDCYTDFEVKFVWKDFLTGKIEHSMTDGEIFE